MSQCTTAAQCLKELARVMEQFGIDNVIDAVNSKYIKSEYKADYYMSAIDLFRNPELWSFAIAEVEGKPVFIGDTLYHINGLSRVEAIDSEHVVLSEGGMIRAFYNMYSWNPPKPKTIWLSCYVQTLKY